MQQSLSSLFQSENEHPTTEFVVSRLNMYFGYVVPILTHRSPFWHADRTSMKELELAQKRVTKWFCRASQVHYKTRLIQLKLLPINLYIEVHDSLTFFKIVADQYNFDREKHITPFEKSSLRTTTSSPFYLPKVRRGKSKDNFWYWTLQLYRRLSRNVNLQELCYVKGGIQDYYWKFFINNFYEENLCSWRIDCQRRTCSPWSNWYLRGLSTLPLEKPIIIINVIIIIIIIIFKCSIVKRALGRQKSSIKKHLPYNKTRFLYFSRSF